MASLRKNVASQNITAQINSATTGAGITTGVSVSVTIDNGTLTAGGGTATHKGGGQWNYAPTQAETNGTSIGFQFSGTGAVSANIQVFTDNYDTTQAVITAGTGTSQLSVTSGLASANTTQFAGQAITAGAGVTIPSSIASPTNITAGTITTTTNLTNAPTAGDFTATMKTSLNSSTPASVTTVTGNVNGSVGSVVGLTASNLDTTISSRMATYTQPTGFLAATFPTGTVANTTNITAGTITTVTNLTNAPTAGDFTAAMKTSLNAATPVVSIGTGGITSSSFASGAITTASFAAGAITAAVTDSTFDNAIATSVFTNAMTEAYATPAGTLTLAKFTYGMNQFFSEFGIVSTTLAVKKRDQVTTAKTYTLNSSTVPTAITETT